MNRLLTVCSALPDDETVRILSARKGIVAPPRETRKR
jgi:hypothetical protein